ncbi:energy-coupling factor transporter ATPase [Alteribacillus bidgolensis]|uniref:Energy-coupling factor transport system ATP-binding protein n=1 Tax=Alteribacillus bidgolensis TaxID=930129 RepID=A0A1G8PBN2_9BACI|nr:energy-coupling factor transporter ATPase [Alteribacillus bidgolensis]SDI89797.1 energy-coupling factor transport system ATP-binding protein [Alteribacillus bidgolensis]
MNAVRLKNVSFRYDEEGPWILNKLNASIHHGEWIAVIGPNGSGKSTLSRLFNGLFSPTLGEVFIGEQSTKAEENLPDIRKHVGMVFQNPDHQFVAPTVRDDIAFGMENAGVEREEMVLRIEQAASQTGVERILEAEPHRLSGGQKQRVAIAGILALHPKIMVLDEVTSMLDPKGRKEVMATVENLHTNEGVTIVSVTHHLHEALLADRVWYMEEGNIAFDLESEKLFSELKWLKDKNIPLPYGFELLEALRKRNQPTSSLETFIRETVKYEDRI